MLNGKPADDLTLEQVEEQSWGTPPPEATKLMTTVYQLRRKPLGALAPEDLRVLLSQQVGVDVLVPRTLDLLTADPLLEGDYYPGDVLVAVLKTPPSYWSAHPDQFAKVSQILQRVGPDEVDAETRRDIEDFRARTSGM
ncbi:MAG TPA: contact-dependent growth inhibition system immunity protein [Candidatus Limnocylindrales bacterium]